jgi:hypothetical protein
VDVNLFCDLMVHHTTRKRLRFSDSAELHPESCLHAGYRERASAVRLPELAVLADGVMHVGRGVGQVLARAVLRRDGFEVRIGLTIFSANGSHETAVGRHEAERFTSRSFEPLSLQFISHAFAVGSPKT